MVEKDEGFLGIKKFFSDKSGFLQVSFGWLFAIIIGAIILFFAIYASVKLIHTEETIGTTETAKEITVLLNPLETGFGEERTTPLSLTVESQINNECDNFEYFGSQEISVAQKISGEWSDAGLSQTFRNKYVFSNETVEGKRFYLFSKPFDFPFNVADLIFLTSSEDKYCFAEAPEEIRKELQNLGQANLFITNCPDDSRKICFDSEGSDCDIIVDIGDRFVEKSDDGRPVYYETDALMYAAIFSSHDLYECQIIRLMERLESLALLYNNKESMLANAGCTAEVSLIGLADAASSLGSSEDLASMLTEVNSADNTNRRAYCELW